MIRNIMFDLGGVLLNLDMPACMEQFAELGMDTTHITVPCTATSPTQGATMCDGMVATGIMDSYQTGDVTTDDFLAGMRAACTPGTSTQQVLQAWNSCLLDIPTYKLDYIRELRQRGYKTYLLSNTNDSHWQEIEQNRFPQPVSQYFDHCFLSHEMHQAKPRRQIYAQMLQAIAAEGEQCLFIDDSQANVDMAEQYGIHTYKTPLFYDWRSDIDHLITQRTYTSHQTVAPQHLADHVHSGDLPVYATPMMIALMENAAMECASTLLQPGQSTVGAQISTTHIRPTAPGTPVRATATLIRQEGRRLHFDVIAHDPQGIIGRGRHIRYIVSQDKFLSKM